MKLGRRGFLTTLGVSLVTPGPKGPVMPGPKGPGLLFEQNLAAPPNGRLVGTIPLGRFDGRPGPPRGTMLGGGLDARLFTDLSALTPETLMTPAEQFFVRTAASAAHAKTDGWTIALAGLARRPAEMSVADLAPLTRDMGAHLIECSGNFDPDNFGLMSAARWSGVPIAALLDRIEPSGRSLVRIAGLDDEAGASQTSVPGASWIFARSDLEKAGAFLATGMNGAPLTPDHGAPVRLVVPNWYGCASIKWVTNVDLVTGDEPATTQMREFAARTHQDGVPALARDFQPATIELAAAPIRVEQWAVDGGIVYRVVGIRWGGSTTAGTLTIRFRHTEPFVPVEDSPAPPSVTTWSLWSHTWRPAQPGRYQIALSVREPSIPARRLAIFYYTREVEVEGI